MDKTNEALTKEIAALINRKQEGGYWDFKLSWHDNKATLLHDIICLANNLENRDAYLIFGAKDKTWDVCGIDKDDKNRRDTLNIVNFLRDKKFFGGVRPMARVETITIERKQLDVLIVENSYNTPFRLEKDFSDTNIGEKDKSKTKTALAKNVYTRVQDTNTPINKTADPDKEEKLWRKRFRIDEPVYNKALYYLEKPEDWKKAEVDLSDSYIANDEIKYPGLKLYRQVSNDSYYYRYAPEYSIEFSSDCSANANSHFLCLLFDNQSGTLMDVIVKANGQAIYRHFYANLDGVRARLVCPCLDFIKLSDDLFNRSGFVMNYIIKGSFDYIINKFLIKSRVLAILIIM